MKYRELAKRLRDLGCEFVRNGAGSHRIWWNPANGRYTSIPDWDGKVWIQRDGTEHGIAEEFAKAGIPKDHIVLGFRSPTIRQYTEYAVA